MASATVRRVIRRAPGALTLERHETFDGRDAGRVEMPVARRAQVHAARHVGSPELHWLADQPIVDALLGAVSRQRVESERAE